MTSRKDRLRTIERGRIFFLLLSFDVFTSERIQFRIEDCQYGPAMLFGVVMAQVVEYLYYLNGPGSNPSENYGIFHLLSSASIQKQKCHAEQPLVAIYNKE